MLTLIRRYGIPILLTVAPMAGIVSLFTLGYDIGSPFGGFFSNRSHVRNVWQVDAATPPWWPGITDTGLQYEDVLVTLDGQPYGPGAREQYAHAAQAGRTTLTLVFRRGAAWSSIQLPLKIFTLGYFLDMRLPDLISGLGFWLLGVVVYRTRPHSPVNRMFGVSGGLTATVLWSSIPTLFPERLAAPKTLHLVWALAYPFMGVAFIHTTLLFPRTFRRLQTGWLIYVYALMAVVAALYEVSFLARWQEPVAWADQLSTFCNWVVTSVFGLGVAGYVARLLWLVSRRGISRRLRRQVTLLLCGLASALPFVLIIVSRALRQTSESYFWNGFDVRYIVLGVPLVFAFVVLRYQTFQSPHPALFGVLMLAGSALAASVGTWLMRLIEPGWVAALNWSPFVPLFIIALLSSWFWSTQSTWRGLFSRFFDWERRSYNTVKIFGQRVSGQSLTQLPDAIGAAFVKTMELERAAVWLWDDVGKQYALAGRAGYWPSPPPDVLRPTTSAWPTQSLLLHEEVETLPDWLSPLGQDGMVEVVTPMWSPDRAVGLLALGRRWDEEIFDPRDLEITELIAQQATLFLLTARQVEELRQVPHQITTMQERERFLIAQELHDTVQQFLGRLPFYLEVSRSAARQNPAETESLLQRCMTDAQNAAQAVRQIRSRLAPLQLEKTFVQPLQLLVEDFRARTGIETRLTLAPDVDTALAPDARHALYRVVQQALDNIAAHAQARCVTVTLTTRAGRLEFSIADDGRGIGAEQRAQAEARGSFGLKSMQARITALGGEFAVRSAAGEGTEITGWLPGTNN
jgi:signal transduction histidine kinase